MAARTARKAPPTDATQDGGYSEKCPPLLKQLQDRVTAALKPHDDRVRRWDQNRKYVAGTMHDDGKKGLVRTNLIYVNQSTIVPVTYAKNPELSITPSASVSPARYKVVKKFAHTLEIVINRLLIREARVKQRMRSTLYSIQTTGEAWLKLGYQRKPQTDYLMQTRINDAQDNLLRINRLIEETSNPNNVRDHERKRDELKAMIESLQNTAEVVVQEGLVLDRILSQDILVLDPTITDFDAYVQAHAIDHMVWMTKDDYVEKFGAWPEEGAPRVYQTRSLDRQNDVPKSGQGTSEHELVCVHELWSRQHGCVFTFGDGASQWAREPYTPEFLPERWYTFFRLGWNFQDGTLNCIEDVTLQRELQDEYNRSRTQWAEHREENMPVRLVRGAGGLSEPDLNNIRNRKNRDIIVVQGNPNVPLASDIAEFPPIPTDPSVYDTTPIRGDMEMVAGRGDSSTGGIVEAKTATEAEIMQAGMMGRSDFRRDIVEDTVQEMAEASAQMLLQVLTVPQVQFIAGEDAVWPQMAREEVFSLVQIEVRAGSTGKPNRAQEQERWEKLFPILMQAVQQIFELQMSGNHVLANAVRQLTKETIRRYDERIDLEELLGPEQGIEEAGAMQTAQLQQQNQELQAQLEQAMAQLQQLDAQRMQGEQEDREYREREFAMKESDMREARDMERQKYDIERLLAERDAQHAAEMDQLRKDMEYQKRLEAMERVTEVPREEIEARMSDVEARNEGVERLVLEETVDPLRQVIDSLLGQIDEFERRMQDAEMRRKERARIVAEALAGPQTKEALRAAAESLARTVH